MECGGMYRGWFFYLLLMTASSTKNPETLAEMQQPMTSQIRRQIRELSYPGDSEMGVFFAVAVPLDDPISTKAVSVAIFFEANYELPNPEEQAERQKQSQDNDLDKDQSIKRNKRRSIDRRMIYSMVESKFESIGYPGKSCLLRSICETTRHSLHEHNGLLGDLFRIIFTPSSSIDEGLPDEYKNAELNDTSIDCSQIYSLCPFGIYDYITGLSSASSTASSPLYK